MWEKSEIIYLESHVNFQTDELEFYFAINTDNNIIETETSLSDEHGSYTGGETNFNKVYIRGSKPNFNKPEIYDYPLTGFAIPYNCPLGTQIDILHNVDNNLLKNGILADMRACSGIHKGTLDFFINRLKENKWSRIFTPTEKFLLRNGQYIKY